MKLLRSTSSFFIALTYLMFSVGFGFSTHYCHGNLSSVSYIVSNPDCGCGDGVEEMSCCTTVKQFYQLDDERLASVFTFNMASAYPVQETGLEFDPEFASSALKESEVSPDFESPPIYLTQHSLIFYA